MKDGLEVLDADLPDNDPDVAAGMERLRQLRELDANVPDLDEKRSRRRD